ncbi:MAG: CocE/NonD family hydrolase, partial [Woeseiaceae bacterium]
MRCPGFPAALLPALLLAGSAVAAAAPGIRIDEVFIPMRDGVRLAADLYIAEGASGTERPVLLEYLPYRKTESRGRNFPLYAYFVERGYVVARVDIRG